MHLHVELPMTAPVGVPVINVHENILGHILMFGLIGVGQNKRFPGIGPNIVVFVCDHTQKRITIKTQVGGYPYVSSHIMFHFRDLLIFTPFEIRVQDNILPVILSNRFSFLGFRTVSGPRLSTSQQ